MASPKILTGYEPSGGSSLFSKGWTFIQDKLYYTTPNLPAQGHFSTFNASGPSVIGFDLLWSAVTIDDIYTKAKTIVEQVYYISLWRNPPAILGTGIDYYFAVAICTTTLA